MPVVRRGERTVEQGALPGVRKQAAETAASEGAGLERAKADTGFAVANFGERVTRFGAAMFARIQEEERVSADQTALLEANNQLSDWKNQRLFDPDTGAFTKKGKDALPLPEEIRGEFQQVSGAIEAKLSTPEQRAAFEKLKSQEWQGIDLQVRRHVLGEMQEYKAGELKATVGNAIDSAIRNALDPKLVAVDLDKAVSAIRTSGPGMGLGQEAIDAQVRAAQSTTHVGVIASLLAQEKDQEARAYFEAAKEQIAGDKQDAVVKALEEGTLRGQSQQKADQIIAAGGTLAEQRKKAKEIDDPKLRDLVEQRIEHNDAVQERITRETEEQNMRTGYDVIDQTHDVTKIPPALWTSYNGSTRAAMFAYANARAKGTPIETDLPTYYSLMQKAGDSPEAFVTTNLLEYRAKLDDVEFKQLAGLQLSIKNADRAGAEKILAPFRTHVQLVDDTLTLHGIDPNAKPDTPEGKAIAQLRRMVDRRVELLQGAGKKATNQDIQAEIDNLLSQSRTVKGSWWNLWPGGAPFFDQQKRLLDLTASDIPPTERAQIEQALKARNRPISDATVLDLYLEMQVRAGRKQ